MNNDEIMRMAREAGWWQPLGLPSDWEEGDYVVSPEQMLRFAALVAAAERGACARVCDEIEETCWESWDTQCDPLDQGSAMGAAHCAAAIRARGEV